MKVNRLIKFKIFYCIALFSIIISTLLHSSSWALETYLSIGINIVILFDIITPVIIIVLGIYRLNFAIRSQVEALYYEPQGFSLKFRNIGKFLIYWGVIATILCVFPVDLLRILYPKLCNCSVAFNSLAAELEQMSQCAIWGLLFFEFGKLVSFEKSANGKTF